MEETLKKIDEIFKTAEDWRLKNTMWNAEEKWIPPPLIEVRLYALLEVAEHYKEKKVEFIKSVRNGNYITFSGGPNALCLYEASALVGSIFVYLGFTDEKNVLPIRSECFSIVPFQGMTTSEYVQFLREFLAWSFPGNIVEFLAPPEGEV